MIAASVLDGLPDLRPPEAENLAGCSDEELGREHLSHSRLDRFLGCPQKYAYTYEVGIEPIRKKDSLSMGGAFQKGVEHQDPDRAYLEIMNDPAPIYDTEQANQRLINATIVRAAAKAYLGRYGAPDSSIREFGYRVRIRNPWTGRYSQTFDLLGYADELEDAGDQGFTLIENKLVGQITATQVKRLPLDRQIALECYGIWRATGRAVTKVDYRYTRKPSIKQRQSETVEEFCRRVEADYEERPDFYLVNRTWFRGSEDLARTEAELWDWAVQIRQARNRSFFPRNTSQCTEYGGCEFLPLCAGDADAPNLYQSKSVIREEQAG